MSNKKTLKSQSKRLTKGSIWKTLPKPSEGKSGNQERLVLHVSSTQVYYIPRGGNVCNNFNFPKRCQIPRFLKHSYLCRKATTVELTQVRRKQASWLEKHGILI